MQLSAAVADVVRSLLAERGWSGRQLARETGINQATMARKLREDSPFDLDDVNVIAQALDVDVLELMASALRLPPGSRRRRGPERGTTVSGGRTAT